MTEPTWPLDLAPGVPHVYAALIGDHPFAARTSLAEAQALCEQAAAKYRSHPADIRWDEEPGSTIDPTVWQLRFKGLSGRWAKAGYSIHALPIA